MAISQNIRLQDPAATGPRVVALTGGIGSGKSVVRQMLEELGVSCIDADKVARDIHQDPAHPATMTLVRTFPHAATSDGRLNRGSLRTLFAIDAAANRELKQILKPWVMEQILQWTQAQQSPYVAWESALILDEAIPVDRVLLVDAGEDVRIARIQTRNPDWSITQIRQILAMQLPRIVYLQHAHDVLHNQGSSAALQRQVAAQHHRYMTIWG